MKEVCIVILVAFVIGGFTLPAEFDGPYPWLYSGKFEGDILLRPEQQGKHGKIDPKARWPNGVIHYEINDDIDPPQQDAILHAITEYHTRTCLKVLPRTDQQNYVEFVVEKHGCFSEIGMCGGRQVINLQDHTHCYDYGTIVHELMHAFGFWHQQADPKRDDYVSIIYDNIEPSEDDINHDEFYKYSDDEATDFGVGYDYGSIMHYPRDALGINGSITIVPKDPDAVIGQNIELSPKDIIKLHRMYNMTDDCKPTL